MTTHTNGVTHPRPFPPPMSTISKLEHRPRQELVYHLGRLAVQRHRLVRRLAALAREIQATHDALDGLAPEEPI